MTTQRPMNPLPDTRTTDGKPATSDRQRHAAALWVCGHVLRQPGDRTQHRAEALEMLRALGLAHDPHAIDINPLTKLATLRGPQEGSDQ